MAHPRFAMLLIAALAAPSVGLAQDTPAPATGTDAAPMPAPTDVPATAPADATTAAPMAADCEGDFTTFDTDGNGYLTQTEAPRDLARATIDEVTLAPEGLTREQYLDICVSDSWTQMTPEAGAPFEGANSFTEAQAQERALAWNVTDVSALTLDDQGVWRGTGKVGADAVSVAVDYKGNVVTTPAMQ